MEGVDRRTAVGPSSGISDNASTAGRVAASLGIAAHGATVVLYLASGLVAPPAGVVFLLVGWAALAVAAFRGRRRRPWLVLLTPVASIGFWVAVLIFGDWVLGWTA